MPTDRSRPRDRDEGHRLSGSRPGSRRRAGRRALGQASGSCWWRPALPRSGSPGCFPACTPPECRWC